MIHSAKNDGFSNLDLVKVLASIEGDHIVGGNSGDRLISRVCGCIESQSRLSWHQLVIPSPQE